MTLVPITWLYILSGVGFAVFVGLSCLLIQEIGKANKWRNQFLCAGELCKKRNNIILAQRARLNRTLAALRKIGSCAHGTELEATITEICREAAKIPPDLEVPEDAVNRELEVLRA